ncbi:MAG: M1 family peptidase, partial [Planctomycetota bacterium]
MIRSAALVLVPSIAFALAAGNLDAQAAPAEAIARAPELLRAGLQSQTRAIRRDVPLTRAIQRAFAAGTRDFTGRPGPNYWQLQTDFQIAARLDRATQSIFGVETIAVHNHSPSELTRIVLRLDHNIFRDRVARGSSVPAEVT